MRHFSESELSKITREVHDELKEENHLSDEGMALDTIKITTATIQKYILKLQELDN